MVRNQPHVLLSFLALLGAVRVTLAAEVIPVFLAAAVALGEAPVLRIGGVEVRIECPRDQIGEDDLHVAG